MNIGTKNLMTIDKLLSLLKTRTSTWEGVIAIDKKYLMCTASMSGRQNNEGGYIMIATLTFSAGTDIQQLGVGTAGHIVLPLDDLTASVMLMSAQYTLKAVNHISDVIKSQMEKKAKSVPDTYKGKKPEE